MKEELNAIDYLTLGEFYYRQTLFTPDSIEYPGFNQRARLVCYYKDAFGNKKRYVFSHERLNNLKLVELVNKVLAYED